MANEKVQLTVEVKGGDSVEQASGKVENLKKRLKELKTQLASGTLDAGTFDRLSKEAGQLQDTIGDVNAQVRNLASDTKNLDGLIGVAEGITGGFAAAQGVMALFGSENEEVQKTLVKVQGAVAALSGVQAIANALQKESSALLFINNLRLQASILTQKIYTAVTGQATAATTAFKVALISTGIGAIVVALGALVAVMSSMGDETDKTTESLKRQNEELEKFKKLAIEEADAEIEKRNAKKGGLNDLKRELDLLKARGATAQEIFNQEQKIRDEERRAINYRLGYLASDAQQQQKLNQELLDNETKSTAAKLELERELTEEKRKRAEERLQKSKQETEQQKRLAEQEKQRIEQLIEQERQYTQQINDLRNQLQTNEVLRGQSDRERQRSELILSYREKYELAAGDAEVTKMLTLDLQASIAELNRKFEEEDLKAKEEAKQKELEQQKAFNDEIIKSEQFLLDSRRGALNEGLNIAQQFAGKNKELANVLFAVQKGAAIAQIIVDTQKEIAGYYANPTWSVLPDGGATIKTAYATGAKIRAATSIGTILATSIGKFSGGGGSGGGSTPSNPSQGGTPNVSSFSTGDNNRNQTGQSGSQRIYVTETDIRSVTNKVNGIYSQATIE